MTWEQFQQLPRNAGYRYEYRGGAARITARPQYYHCLRSLSAGEPEHEPLAATAGEVSVRPLEPNDWDHLPGVFAAAFSELPPLVLERPADRLITARELLARTRAGADGPIVERACWVALAADEIVGAIHITLSFDGDLETFDDPGWTETPPPDALEQRWGRPHLTWIYIRPAWSRRGIGRLLLACASRRLAELGYRELASTFQLGNASSQLWHWRLGFRLLSYVGSPGRLPCLPERT
jgi:GNAT superfamily N-acetyltransferase